jgi:putative ABC transport system permease protein
MLAYAVRSLRRNPVFTLVAIVSLGLALALNTSVFAVADALTHPVNPYSNGARAFTTTLFAGDKRRPASADAKERALVAALDGAEDIATMRLLKTMIASTNRAEDGFVEIITPNQFDVLGVRPIVGRPLPPESAASAPGALISYQLWTRFFNRRPLDASVLLSVGNRDFPVLGVMPRGVHGLLGSDVWLPVSAFAGDTAVMNANPFITFCLKPGVSPAPVRVALQLAATRLAQQYGQNIPSIVTMRGWVVGSYLPPSLVSVMSIAAIVMLIACANLGSMMLARGMARRREIAIRIALGASRRIIIAETLAECGVVVACGIALGLVLTLWSLSVIPHFVLPSVGSLSDIEPSPSWRVFAFAAIVATATLIVAGFLPSVRAASVDPAEPIKEGATTTYRRRDRYNPLIIAEVAISTRLLMTAALFALRAMQLEHFQFQYYAHRLVTAQARASVEQSSRPGGSDEFFDDLLAHLDQLPATASAATHSVGAPDHGVVSGEQSNSATHWTIVSQFDIVSPQYLSTVGIPIVAGRDFQLGDRGDSAGVVIVDDHMAHLLWPDGTSPIGQRLKLGAVETAHPWMRVVGVARWTELQPRDQMTLAPEPKVYVVLPHDETRDRDVIVRGNVDVNASAVPLTVVVRRTLQGVASWSGFPNVHAWLANYDTKRTTSSFMSTVFSVFSAFGLILCAVGLYGVLAYSVARRERELAIRVSLGARPATVARHVLHDIAVTVLAGIAAGAFVALIANHRLGDSLFDLRYELVISLVVAEGLVVIVGAIAGAGPVLKALRADPVAVLRAN